MLDPRIHSISEGRNQGVVALGQYLPPPSLVPPVPRQQMIRLERDDCVTVIHSVERCGSEPVEAARNSGVRCQPLPSEHAADPHR